MKNFGIITMAIAFVGMLGYGAFLLERWINYTFSYESSVAETVREIVKPECLKEQP